MNRESGVRGSYKLSKMEWKLLHGFGCQCHGELIDVVNDGDTWVNLHGSCILVQVLPRPLPSKTPQPSPPATAIRELQFDSSGFILPLARENAL